MTSRISADDGPLRVVVVGATGNVGTGVVRALSRDPGIGSIVGIARRTPSWSVPKTEWVSADVADERAGLTGYFAGADVVVHLAWMIQPARHPATTWRTNVLGSIRVFDAVAAAGVPALVYASSIGAYSPGPKDRAVDESWPTHGWPEAPYPREKAYVERLLDTFEFRHPGVRVVRMRPGFIFQREAAAEQRRLFAGPLVPGRLVRAETVPAVPDLPGLRFQVLHTDDAAEAYRLAVTRPVRGAFNLAADPVVDARLLAELLNARVVRLPAAAATAALTVLWQLHAVPVPPGLLRTFLRLPVMDTARARTELGWQPRSSAREALDQLLRGLREAEGGRTPPLKAGAR